MVQIMSSLLSGTKICFHNYSNGRERVKYTKPRGGTSQQWVLFTSNATFLPLLGVVHENRTHLTAMGYTSIRIGVFDSFPPIVIGVKARFRTRKFSILRYGLNADDFRLRCMRMVCLISDPLDQLLCRRWFALYA